MGHRTPRVAFAWWLSLLLWVPTSSELSGGEAGRKTLPNFILLLADDLGWADLGCYGADLHETPSLDRLAAGELRFTDAYAAAPVCSPTRASILTGKCPARLHITIWRESAKTPTKNKKLVTPTTVADLPHEETTFAAVLQQAGYLTAHVGKWHLGDAAYNPETHGFDINIGGTHWGAPQTHFYPYRGRGTFGGEFRYVPHLEWGRPGEYLADRLTSEALAVMERAKDRPFFLNLWWHAVHTPIEFLEDMRVELYNLKEDLGEKHDLNAEMPERAESLRRQLHAWRQTVGAQMPTPALHNP
jgi:arylsulfatase A-like enzyme